MLGVAQESVRPLLTNTHSQLGHSCPRCWWTVFGGLHTLFSVKNKGFHSKWCWNKWVPMFVPGKCTMIRKDLEQSLNHSWEKTTPIGFKEWGDSLKWFWEYRTQNQSKCKDLSDWTQEIRSHPFSISHPYSFIPSSLIVLAWQLSSLRLLHLMRESKLPALGFYIPKASPIRKKIADIRVQVCSLKDPPQITCTAPYQPTWWGHGVLWLALYGHWPWPRGFCFLQNFMTEAWERQLQG